MERLIGSSIGFRRSSISETRSTGNSSMSKERQRYQRARGGRPPPVIAKVIVPRIGVPSAEIPLRTRSLAALSGSPLRISTLLSNKRSRS
jgi:hypothetical protein